MAEPTSPRWPATKMRADLSMGGSADDDPVAGGGEGFFLARELEVAIDHEADELGEFDPGGPAEAFAGLGGVAEEIVDFGGAEVARIDFDVAGPIEAAAIGGEVEELLDGMRLAGGDDVIVGAVGLEHQPHGFDVVA